MLKIKSLHRFLSNSGYHNQSFFLKKLAIEIEEEELKEAVREATEERDNLKLFDYSDLFEPGKDYVILKTEPEPRTSETEAESDQNSFRPYEDAKQYYDKLGSHKTPEDYYEKPEEIELFGQVFDLDYGLSEPCIKIYSNVVVSKMRSFFKENFIYLQDEIKNNPINYFMSKNITPKSNVGFELSYYFFSSAPILKSFSNFSNVVLQIAETNSFNVDMDELTKVYFEVYNQCVDMLDALKNIFEISEWKDLHDQMISDALGKALPTSEKYSIVISYNPQDIATASYKKCVTDVSADNGTSWESCKSGEGIYDLLEDVKEGGLIAWLVSKDNPYPIKNPVARVRIRHYSDNNRSNPKDFVLAAEKRVYGDIEAEDKKFFLDNVNIWVNNANGKINTTSSRYQIAGDRDTDTLPSFIVPKQKSGNNSNKELALGRKVDEKQMVDLSDKTMEYNPDAFPVAMAATLMSKKFKIEDLNKAIKRFHESFLNIGELDSEEMFENIIPTILSKMLKTPQGRNLQHKSNDGTISKEDISEFLKKAESFVEILIDCDFNQNDEPYFVDGVDNILSQIIKMFNEVSVGKKISSTFYTDSDVVSVTDNFFKKKILENKSNDQKYVCKRINLLYSQMNSRYEESLSDSIIAGKENGFFDYIFKANDEGDGALYESFFNLSKEYVRIIFEELCGNEEDLCSEIMSDAFGTENDDYLDVICESFENINKFISIVSKNISNFGNTLSGNYRSVISFLLKASKKYSYDFGTLSSNTIEDAEKELCKILMSDLTKISSCYNIIDISKLPRAIKNNFFARNSGFVFKKRTSCGGSFGNSNFSVNAIDYTEGEAKEVAKLVGLEESSISKDRWSSTGSYSVVFKK